jgi:hypothetical protein
MGIENEYNHTDDKRYASKKKLEERKHLFIFKQNQNQPSAG